MKDYLDKQLFHPMNLLEHPNGDIDMVMSVRMTSFKRTKYSGIEECQDYEYTIHSFKHDRSYTISQYTLRYLVDKDLIGVHYEGYSFDRGRDSSIDC